MTAAKSAPTMLTIGKVDREPFAINLDLLLRTRMLLTASSGAGKTETVRTLVEAAFGHVQIFVIDPEGEFSTLREKFAFVLVGKDGETPADIRSAALVATRLLELNASAVCDLYEMRADLRHEWVKRFLDAMIEAPKNLYRDVLVIVDEAHLFAPEKGQGESVASASMIDLCSRGRKRGYCAVFATQRISRISKSVTGVLDNRMVGRTNTDDQDRAAAVLRIPKAEERAFYGNLANLDDGEFFVVGRALSPSVIRVRMNRAATKPAPVGAAAKVGPPPAPTAIKALLPQLADLPHEAEKKAKTEQELRAELQTAKQQIRQLETKLATSDDANAKAMNARLTEQLTDAREQIQRAAVAYNQTRDLAIAFGATLGKIRDLTEVRQQMPESFPNIAQLPSPSRIPDARRLPTPSDAHPSRPIPAIAPTRRQTSPQPHSDISAPMQKILDAVARLERCGITPAPRLQVALLSGYSNTTSGGFARPVAAVVQAGLVSAGAGALALTESGHAATTHIDGVFTTEDLHRQLFALLGGGESKLLRLIIDAYPAAIKRDKLAAAAGYSNTTSGGFARPLARLGNLGLVESPASGYVRGTDLLFLEEQ